MTTYRTATDDDISFYRDHGWLVVADVIDPADLAEVEGRCNTIIEHRDAMAFDWAWEEGTAKEERPFKILQSSPSLFWPEVGRRSVPPLGDRVRLRADGAAGRVLVRPVPRQVTRLRRRPRTGTRTRATGVATSTTAASPAGCRSTTSTSRNGCMHFIDGGHHDGVLVHEQPPGIKSDLLLLPARRIAHGRLPDPLGRVTFHHGKTPHMTTGNSRPTWRRTLTQHLRSWEPAAKATTTRGRSTSTRCRRPEPHRPVADARRYDIVPNEVATPVVLIKR